MVASDGINNPAFSPASNAVTLQSSIPSITGPTAVVTDFLTLNPVDRAGNTDPDYWGTADISASLAVNGVAVGS